MYFFIIVVSTVGSGILFVRFFYSRVYFDNINLFDWIFTSKKNARYYGRDYYNILYISHLCYPPLQFSYKATKLLDCYHLTYRRKLRIGLGESQPNYASNFNGYYLIDGCESSRDIAELFGVVRTEARRFPTGVDCAVG